MACATGVIRQEREAGRQRQARGLADLADALAELAGADGTIGCANGHLRRKAGMSSRPFNEAMGALEDRGLVTIMDGIIGQRYALTLNNPQAAAHGDQ